MHAFSISLDGYGAGPNQSLENPLGEGGMALHEWVFPTRTFRRMEGVDVDGEAGIDDAFVAKGFEGIGATIMGRNMFGPIRGEWPDDSWTGWWGSNPPYHHPVFVLTHHPREPITMEGGTTFNFVTGGIEDALEQAFKAAKGADVRLGGGVSTVREYLFAGLVDELHMAIAPVLLGSGEHLLGGLGDSAALYESTPPLSSDAVTHIVLTRRA